MEDPQHKALRSQTSLKEILKDLICGSLGGLAGTCASHPLDTIRIRLQLQDHYNPMYKGILDCGKQAVSKEGFLGLYKGILPPIIFQCPTYAFLFAGKELADRALNKMGGLGKDTQSCIAGCIGGVASTVVSCPAELLKIRSQYKTSGNTDYFKLAKTLVKNQGYSALYKGYLCTLIRDIPAFAVYFGIFEIGCARFTSKTDMFYVVLLYQLIFGSIAGIASWLITYPFDIVKSIIQNSDKHRTIRQVFYQNYKLHGAQFFLKGAFATSIKAVPMEATCLILYTQLRERI